MRRVTRWLTAPWFRRSATVGAALLIVGIALPRMASFAEIRPALATMSWPFVVVLTLVTVWNLLSYGLVVAAATPGMTRFQGLVVTQSSGAVANALPGGGALGIGVTAAMYRSWGFTPASTSLAVLMTGIWNVFLKLSLPVAVLGLLLATGDASWFAATRVGIGVGLVVASTILLVKLVRHDRFVQRTATLVERGVNAVRRVVRRTPVTGWAASASLLRIEAHDLLRHRWLRLTLATAASHLSAFAVLYFAVRGVGIDGRAVGALQILGAFALVRVLSTIPITPGGVGVVEVGLSGALIAAGAARGPAVAGVLVFRTLTYLTPIVAGLPAYLVWRYRTSWRTGAVESAGT